MEQEIRGVIQRLTRGLARPSSSSSDPALPPSLPPPEERLPLKHFLNFVAPMAKRDPKVRREGRREGGREGGRARQRWILHLSSFCGRPLTIPPFLPSLPPSLDLPGRHGQGRGSDGPCSDFRGGREGGRRALGSTQVCFSFHPVGGSCRCSRCSSSGSRRRGRGQCDEEEEGEGYQPFLAPFLPRFLPAQRLVQRDFVACGPGLESA